MSLKRHSSDEEADPAGLLEHDPLHYDDGHHLHRGATFNEEEAGLIGGNGHAVHTASVLYTRRPGCRGFVQRLRCQRTSASKLGRKAALSRGLQRLGFVVAAFLMCLGVLQLVGTLHGAYTALFPAHHNHVITNWDQIGKGELGKTLGHYLTDFTRDVIPVPCHSHNDYWRDVPLYSGISAGCISTEADVWFFDSFDDGGNPDDYGSRLLVGHDQSSLSRNRTLRSLYVDPLLEILNKQNPTTEFVDGSKTMNGVFDTDPDQVMTLLIDFKTAGNDTFDAVVKAVDPLRQKGYLTHVDDTGMVINRPIRVIGTGNTPFQSVLSGSQNPHRDIFFDAPIDNMAASAQDPERALTKADGASDYSPSNSYYASGSFTDNIGIMWGFSLTSKQLAKLRAQIRGAHSRGLKVRYWETPAWPVLRRNRLWEILVEEGADVLNVDDLKAAAKEDWRRARALW